MAVAKRDIAASVLVIAEMCPSTGFGVAHEDIPIDLLWVLDDKFKKYRKGIVTRLDGHYWSRPDWRTAFDAGIGRWLRQPLDQGNVSQ